MEKNLKKLNLEIGDFITILSSDSFQTVLEIFQDLLILKLLAFLIQECLNMILLLIFLPIKLMQNFLNTGETIDFFEIQVNKFQNIDSTLNDKKLLPKYFTNF